MYLQFNEVGDIVWPTYRRLESLADTVCSSSIALRNDYLRSVQRMIAAKVPHAHVHLFRLQQHLQAARRIPAPVNGPLTYACRLPKKSLKIG